MKRSIETVDGDLLLAIGAAQLDIQTTQTEIQELERKLNEKRAYLDQVIKHGREIVKKADAQARATAGGDDNEES